jgi:hypothetical protein
MRKIFLVLLGMVMLSGCVATASPSPAPVQFNASARVQVDEHQFAAQLQQFRPGALVWAYSAPEEIAGMQLHLQDDIITLRDGDLTADVLVSALPASNVVVLLNGVLLQLAQNNADSFTLTGTTNGFAYTAELSPQGELLRLNIPVLNMEVTLSYN